MRANDRLVAIVELLSEEGPLTLSALASDLELSKATALRYLRSLEVPGWIERDKDSRYNIGPGVIALARRYLSANSLFSAAALPMSNLRDRLRETASLSSAVGNKRICMQEYPSPEALRHVHEIGASGPLHAGASGKLLLAYLPDEVRSAILTDRLVPYTEGTIVSPERLERECQTIRERGWALSYGERTAGSVAVAVPVRTGNTDSVAALALFAPRARFDPDRDRETWIRELQECAAEIEAAMGVRREGPDRSYKA